MPKKQRGDKLTTSEGLEVIAGASPDGTVRVIPVDSNGVVPVSFTGASPDFPSVVTLRDKDDLTRQAKVDADGNVQVEVNNFPASPFVSLTSRMKAFNPQDGYRIWVETGLADYIYIAEAPVNAVATDATFAGIRIPLVGGNPSGEVQVATDMVWNTKAGTWQ